MSELSDADFLTQAEERCWLMEMKDRAGKLGTECGHRRQSVRCPQFSIAILNRNP